MSTDETPVPAESPVPRAVRLSDYQRSAPAAEEDPAPVTPIEEVDNASLTKRQLMTVVSASLDEKGLVGHNLDGFNELIESGIPRIMTELFNVHRQARYGRVATELDRSRSSVEIAFQFHDVQIGRPTCTTYMTGQFAPLYPGAARLTGLPYSGAVTLAATVSVRLHYEDGRVEEKRADIAPFQIGGFPIMVRSRRCHTSNLTRAALKELGEDPTDPGGYFIAKRGEFVVDLLENIRYNSAHFHREMRPNEHLRAEFISQPGGAFENSSQIRLRYMKNGQITIEINSTKIEHVRLPFWLIYRLFGMTDDREIAATIVFDVADGSPQTVRALEIVQGALHAADAAYAPLVPELNRERLVQQTAERVAKYLTNPKAYLNDDHAIQFLNEDLLGNPDRPGGLDKIILPHMGQTAESRIRKLRFIGLLIHKMLLVHFGVMPPTDRDSYRNKRVHGAGVSLAKAFKTQVNNSVVTPLYRALLRELKNNPWESVTERTLSDAFRNALATSDLNRAMEQAITAGNKTIIVRKRAATNRVSSQALERKNCLNTISALRTIVAQNASNASKQTDRADKMRRAHPTYAGYICLSQSPDTGETVGLKKQLASTADVCTAGDAAPLKLRLLDDPAVTELDAVASAAMLSGLARVYVNGEWIGCAASAAALVARYRAARRAGRGVDPRTTITWDPLTDEVEFWLDVGRLVRPLLIVDNNLAAYDAAAAARHAWLAAHADAGGVVVYQPGEGADATRVPAGLYYAALGEYVAFTRLWLDLGHDPLGYVHNGPDALVAAGLATPAPAPPGVAKNDANAPKRERLAELSESAPKRVDFVQNTRFTSEHARAITEGRLTLAELITAGIAEYITPEEQENCLIAESIDVLRAARHDVTRRYTHLEVEQALLGLAAHMSPYGNHTQPARVTYETNQSRQTGGWYALNFPFRTDKNRFLQFYNEVPLVRTLTSKVVPSNGLNTVIAYMSYTGDNQEDSAIVCRASADRGMFAGAFFRYELAELEKGEMFCTPDELTTKNLKPNASYEKLVDGFVAVGSVVRFGDALVGRVAKLGRGKAAADEKYQFTDRSVIYRSTEPAVVEDVLRPRGVNDELFAVVKLRYERPLRIGDKMCLTPDHDVLTAAGWKPVGEVTTADLVLCAPLVNEVNEVGTTRETAAGRTVFAPPSAVHRFEVSEPLYEIRGRGIDQRVTAEHRLPVALAAPGRYALVPTWIAAAAAPGKFDMVYPGAVYGPLLDTPPADSRLRLADRLGMDAQALRTRPRADWAEIHTRQAAAARAAFEAAAAGAGDAMVTLDELARATSARSGTRDGLLYVAAATVPWLAALAALTGVWRVETAGQIASWVGIRVTADLAEPIGVSATPTAEPYVGPVHCLTVPGGMFCVRRGGAVSWTGNSSRSGNKSIAARLLSQSDMPFTESGLTPDIIINTNSFPTRMTIGQLIESYIAKACARRGVLVDGTSFLPVDHEDHAAQLLAAGFRFNGRERMYNGFTGEHVDAAIFIAITAEQRLQKFVLDDEQAVAGSGPTDATTGQPLGGKHVHGGLRLGEMEVWGLVSHGSMLNMSEKGHQDSDGRPMHVCRGCGQFAVYNEYRSIYACRRCGDLADIATVDGRKTAVLIHEELAAANIRVRMGLRPREFEETPAP
jgi:DNA-directed RNA polymerase beta subunit